ncbi:MAG: DUF4143 domain-containing protein [Sutterellaceae bacterium]|nr:DUF4143 domain-containing protein [Sutterellaceae bacterium]
MSVTGMRGSGKTALSQREEQARGYVSLADFVHRELAGTSPTGFLKSHPAPVTLDDIEHVPQLLAAIEAATDHSDAPGQYLIASSLRLKDLSHIADTFPEQTVHLNLMPLSIYERAGLGNKQKPFVPSLACFDAPPFPTMSDSDLWATIFRGGFPEIVTETNLRQCQEFYESLLDEILRLDVRAICHFERSQAFRKFLKALAHTVGEEVQFNRIAHLADISMPTAKRWIEIARLCGLAVLIPGLEVSGIQTVKRPKLYLSDTGLLSMLLDFRSSAQLSEYALAPQIFENFVVLEILKSHVHNGLSPKLFHYRDNKCRSVPLMIVEGDTYRCVDIGLTAYPKTKLRQAEDILKARNLKIGFSSMICTVDKPRGIAPETVAQGVWTI